MNSVSMIIFLFMFSVFGLSAQYTEADWEDRDTWMKTDFLLQMAGVEAGHKVADIGCHEGYLSIRLAERVRDNGRVYSVDVRSDRLEKLRTNANTRNLKNIVTILGDYDDPKLPERELDFVFIIDTYHEMESYNKILGHVKKSLKPGGKLMILEKLKDWVRNKSRKEQVASHSLGPEYVREELEEAGFSLISEIQDHGDWEKENNKQMWVILAEKPK
ncbi:class I SAM-dependent methyltransferase [Flagellimonas nanhaiensis]|uniref:Class I SAM-dependent methyltransferase n=2 Tax=Flagellimonas nanhaiensis TaxID=2292706 RepID=A0A371JUV6_9FLAO|nr:class I SAM-dependent methyltransferase [Allomuricauda nanhaiensis]